MSPYSKRGAWLKVHMSTTPQDPQIALGKKSPAATLADFEAACSLIRLARTGVVLQFAPSAPELLQYLGLRTANYLDDDRAKACARIALDSLFEKENEPCVLFPSDIEEIDNELGYQLSRRIAAQHEMVDIWAKLPRYQRESLERLQSRGKLSPQELLDIVRAVRQSYEQISASLSALRFDGLRALYATLNRLLESHKVVFYLGGDSGLPMVPSADLGSLAEEMCRTLWDRDPATSTRLVGDRLDTEALAATVLLNQEMRGRRLIRVGGSARAHTVLGGEGTHYFPAMCSLDAYFLYSVCSGSINAEWDSSFESELRSTSEALKLAIARRASGQAELDIALDLVRASLAHLLNHRLAAKSFDTADDSSEDDHMNPGTSSAGLADISDLIGRRADVLTTFVGFVSGDGNLRKMLADDHERTWGEVGSAIDRLRRLGRYRCGRSCFISYAVPDAALATRLARDLENAGIRRWIAPDSLLPGDDFAQCIEEAIAGHECVLVLISEESIRSPWVRREVDAGLDAERRRGRSVVIPINVDRSMDSSEVSWVASLRRSRHAADFADWRDERTYLRAFDNLLLALRTSGAASL